LKKDQILFIDLSLFLSIVRMRDYPNLVKYGFYSS